MTRATPLQAAFVVIIVVASTAVLVVDSPVGLALIAASTVSAVAFTSPTVVFGVVMAMSFVQWRIGPSAVALSVSDAALTAATGLALLLSPWSYRRVRSALGALTFYLAILLVVVGAHPTSHAMFEWTHRIVLVGGAIVVGAALWRLRGVVFALRTLMLSAAIIAGKAISESLGSGLDPAYPFGIQKNTAGVVLALALIVPTVAPDLLRLPLRLVGLLRILLLLGLLASQSRGSMVALAAGIGLWGAHSMRRKTRSRMVIIVVVVGVVGLVFVNEREAAHVQSDPGSANFTGEATRQKINDAAFDHFLEHPVTGAGLRYFNTPPVEAEPHNVVASQLAEGGVVGLVALILLLVGAFRALRGLTGPLATIARLALLVKLLAAMFDIYWVAGSFSLPWVLVGIALAAEEHELPRRVGRLRRALATAG